MKLIYPLVCVYLTRPDLSLGRLHIPTKHVDTEDILRPQTINVVNDIISPDNSTTKPISIGLKSHAIPGKSNGMKPSLWSTQRSSVIDNSSILTFEDQVNSMNKNSVVEYAGLQGGMLVKENADEEFIFIFSVVATLVAADQVFNEGAITTYVANNVILPLVEAVGQFLKVLNEVLAKIFEKIGDIIYEFLNLGTLDKFLRRVINGGISNFMDTVGKRLMSFIDNIRNVFKGIAEFIGTIKNGLDKIGSLDFIKKIFGLDKSASNLTMNNNQSFSINENKLIKVSGPNGQYGYISAKEQEFIQGSGGLQDLVKGLTSGTTVNIMKKLQTHIANLRDSYEKDPLKFMKAVIDDIIYLVKDLTSGLREFLAKTDSMGCIQFLLTAEAEAIVGAGFEVGVSIDVKQLLYYVSHGQWDKSMTQLASLHVGYALDAGIQGGGDAGLSIAYHTSRVNGVNGFGWGFSLEGAFGYGAGVGVAWALPGPHIPNQYVAQVLGAGAKFEMSAFIGHGIIIGYYDTELGIIPATPSISMAKSSGHPSLYYSKYNWGDLDFSTIVPIGTAQSYFMKLGWTECSWDRKEKSCIPPATSMPPATSTKSWHNLNTVEKTQLKHLGYTHTTWNAPIASRGRYYTDPYGDYFKKFLWTQALPYEKELFICLGWDSSLWGKTDKAPDSWNIKWNSMTLEMRICATAIGYDELKWKKKSGFQCQPSKCTHDKKYKYLPLDMSGQVGTVATPAECQQRCKDTPGCLFFNSFRDGSCHITTGAVGAVKDNNILESGGHFCKTESGCEFVKLKHSYVKSTMTEIFSTRTHVPYDTCRSMCCAERSCKTFTCHGSYTGSEGCDEGRKMCKECKFYNRNPRGVKSTYSGSADLYSSSSDYYETYVSGVCKWQTLGTRGAYNVGWTYSEKVPDVKTVDDCQSRAEKNPDYLSFDYKYRSKICYLSKYIFKIGDVRKDSDYILKNCVIS